MKYLLDTCVVSDYFRRTGNVAAMMHARPPHDLAISSVTEYEMRFGLARQKKASPQLASKVKSFIEVVRVLPFSSREAATAAIVRARLESDGHPIGALDVLIGAVAVAHDLVLVTSNEKEFDRIEGLLVENWR